jgi:1,4-alpha-glucan branching enzyme
MSAVIPAHTVYHDVTRLSAQDLYLFNEGTHSRLYQKLGAHVMERAGVAGTYFAVWAPAAEYVAVVGDFNGWDPGPHSLRPRASSGIWEGFIAGLAPGALYKFHIASRYHGYNVDKADPFAFLQEQPPRTGSVVHDLAYAWDDGDWMAARRRANNVRAPMSIYEVHLGSWMRVPEEGNRWLSYRELAPKLAGHVRRTGFTHVEFLPVMEHPFYGSWGYQVTGFFAPSSRYGSPQDFMFLVDYLHQQGIGIILDWVPAHFPTDQHGLVYFDGTHLYEHADPRQGYHPDWQSSIFNFSRHEVRSFLLSSAVFWLDHYHADGLRVDAVASVLYLDYSRQPGEWVPNEFGGRENLHAVSFLRRFNEEIYREYPDTQTVAEESTAWPMVSRPTYLGGLGFGLKWDMGWMHDTLAYLRDDPIHRQYHHNQLTFRAMYANAENYVLPLSHDEVVHGKGSLLAKMPGDSWQQFANLRLLFGYMWATPGKKLLFMGGEFGQGREWNHDSSLDWHQLGLPPHYGVLRWIMDLNRLYREERSLHEGDCQSWGFEWVDASDAGTSVLTFLRLGGYETALVVCNFTPVVRHEYRVGVPHGGYWRELLNGDAPEYGGSGVGNEGGVMATAEPCHGRPCSLLLTLPPLAVVFFKGP